MFVPGFHPLLFTNVVLTGGVSGDTIFHDADLRGAGSARIVAPLNAFSITGILEAQDGTIFLLSNRTGFTITLEHEHTGSVAANRFNFNGSDISLTNGKNVMIFYDSGDQRWHKVNDV